jgi:hypothetical protein
MELDDLVLRDRHEVPGKDQEIRELSRFDGTFGAAVGARFAALMVRPARVFRTTFVGRPSAWGTCAEGQRALVVALIEDHVAITAAERVSCFPILRPLPVIVLADPALQWSRSQWGAGTARIPFRWTLLGCFWMQYGHHQMPTICCGQLENP